MKITKHPNGLNLYWGTYFFLYDAHGPEQGSYKASVEAQGYNLKQIDSTNWHLMTPAQQIMWTAHPTEFAKYVLSPMTRQWLEQNIGQRGPDWYAREAPFDLMFLSILFRLRRDALRFTKYVNQCLEMSKP